LGRTVTADGAESGKTGSRLQLPQQFLDRFLRDTAMPAGSPQNRDDALIEPTLHRRLTDTKPLGDLLRRVMIHVDCSFRERFERFGRVLVYRIVAK
jgi:hypothetical protein